MTAPDLNLSPFAHEISSVEATKGGKFTEVQYMDISFLQLPSHIWMKIAKSVKFYGVNGNSDHFTPIMTSGTHNSICQLYQNGEIEMIKWIFKIIKEK